MSAVDDDSILLTLPADAPVNQLEEALAALANQSGGTLALALTPLSDVEDSLDRVLQAALSIEPPLIMPLPRRVGQRVMAVVPSGMPHVYATSSGRYVRHDHGTIVTLLPRELRRLMMTRGELTYESETVVGATRDDLDWDRIADYAARLSGYDAGSTDDLMLRRGCLMRVGNALIPTRAGILLFGKDPQRFVRSALITAVRFAGDTMSDRHSRQDINGTLVDQIKRAETFLHDHLRRDVTLGAAMARHEHYEYPMEAARELLINAIAHRDYAVEGDNIRLLIFHDRMEIHSPGGLPGYMTLLNLKEERFSRNPVIVQILSDMLYIERLGYGVDRVLELMQARHLRAPQFAERAGSFDVTLYNDGQTAASSSTNTPPPGLFEGQEVNLRQERALDMLISSQTGRLTNSDLQALFPDVHSETLRRDLADLVTKRILVKLGKKRGSYYVLRREGQAYPATKETE